MPSPLLSLPLRVLLSLLLSVPAVAMTASAADNPAAKAPETKTAKPLAEPKDAKDGQPKAAKAGHDIERYLQFRSATSPTFSPDGGEVAFLTGITGVTQVWAVPTAGGWPQQWTFSRHRVSLVRWSPVDNDILLIARDTDGNEKTQLYLLRRGGRDVLPLTDKPEAIFRFGAFSEDGAYISYSSNKRNGKDFDVYALELATRTEKLVLQGEGDHAAGRFSPDNRKLIVQKNNGGGDDEIIIADLITGRVENVTPVRPANYGAVFWGPPGKLLLVSDAEREFYDYVALELATKSLTFPQAVTAKSERDVESLLVRRSAEGGGEFATYTVNDGGRSRLFVKVFANKPEEIALPFPSVVGGLTSTRDGRTLAMTLAAPDRPTDIWVMTPSGGFRQLTFSSMAGLAPADLVVPETVSIRSFDGLEIPAFLYLPKGAKPDGKLPAVLHMHGGPEGQWRPMLSPVVQYLVGRGYAVLEPNVRGSTGYGKRFEHLDDVRKRLDAVRDMKAAADWLKAGGYVHPKRVAVMGGSYGGYMTLAAVTEYPEDFAAAVDLFGIADFEAFLKNTGAYRRALREAEYGSLEKDLDFLREISPIRKVDKIKTPLLVIQGSNDPRVPQSESDAIVKSLRDRKAAVEYILFPDEGHGIAKQNNKLKAYRGVAEFLEKHVRDRE
jgi:dipeptidyl aminopeptidase/acylaminoacyl peptidase